jgi:hypothetical protein
MTAALRALLADLIDYAGMFPPARLPLEQALENYAAYRRQPDAWMLGRFICPAASLAELAEALPRFLLEEQDFLALSVLGRGGANAAAFVEGAESDSTDIGALRQRLPSQVRIDVYELRLPPAGELHSGQLEALLDEVLETLDTLAGDGQAAPRLVCEVPASPSWRERNTALLSALQEVNHGRGPSTGLAGFKLRCGGETPTSFPWPEQVAFCLRQCLDRQVPFKATAGLHHPLPRFDPALQTSMHGFINVFGGGVLAAARGLNEEQIQAILTDAEPGHFVFTDERLSWHHLIVSTGEIERLRRDSLLSFGSCSFDEPREDLKALGWLEC